MKYLNVFIISCVLLSCDKSEYVKVDRTETLYLIEKSTSKVSVVDEDRLVPVTALIETSSTTNYKRFSTFIISALDSLKCNLETNYYDGYLYYKFNIEPVVEKIKVKSSTKKFFINFTDNYGFNLYKLEIPLEDMSRVRDENYNISGYNINLRTPLSYQLYKSFSIDWIISWSGL